MNKKHIQHTAYYIQHTIPGELGLLFTVHLETCATKHAYRELQDG